MWLLELAVLLHNYVLCSQVLCTKKRDFLLNASPGKSGLMGSELGLKLKSTSGIPGPPERFSGRPWCDPFRCESTVPRLTQG